MDGPRRPNLSSADTQVPQTDKQETKGKALNRFVALLKGRLPLLRRGAAPVDSGSGQTSLSERKAVIPPHTAPLLAADIQEKNPVAFRADESQEYSSVDEALKPELPDGSFQKPLSRRSEAGSNRTYKALYDHQKLMFATAILVAKGELADAVDSGDAAQIDKLTRLVRQLQDQLSALKGEAASKADEPVSRTDKKRGKKLPGTLKGLLIKSGMEKRTVVSKFHQFQTHILNSEGWQCFHREFVNPAAPDKPMISEQVPACEMGNIFTTPYKKGTGVSCVDTGNSAHANNLWKSRFMIGGRAVFNGIRHGIIDAAGIRNSAQRARAAEKKAEETLVAALASKPELYKQAIEAARDGGDMTPPRLLATSTSLVTTGAGSSHEKKMQEQQNKAFKALIKKAKGKVLVLSVPGPDGVVRKVKFELKLSRFNIPVNFGGVGPLQKITSGRSLQRSMNKPAMAELLGKGKDIDGDTAFHLKQLDWQIKQKTKQKSFVKPEQQDHLKQEIAQLELEMKIVTDMASQIKDIYRSGSHHREGHDTYKLAARVVYLTHLIGGVPLYNCKSGKDRTGMLDAEVKLLAAQIERDGKVPRPGRLSTEDRALFRNILLNSGNHQVQKANVAVEGYKTELIDSITERVGDDEVREEVRGLSQVTSK